VRTFLSARTKAQRQDAKNATAFTLLACLPAGH